MNAAIKKLRGNNPNANWKNVNNTNLSNGQRAVLRGLKAGLQSRAAAAQANNMNASALFKQVQRPVNQRPKRNLKEIYDFPGEGTFQGVIQAVSQDVWKHFKSRKDPAEIAWLVLKSRGQTVNRTPYRAGFIMDQYNWKNLYDRFKNGPTSAEYKQVMRYILAMLAMNPPYVNRSTGNRDKLSGMPRIGTMNNTSFNAYLKGLTPVKNQGGGLIKAALRTTASGAGLASRTAINQKSIILPIATVALTAGLAGGPMAAGTAARVAAKQALRTAVVGGLKSKFGNNPVSNAVINRAVSLAETKITSQTAPTNTSVKAAIANAANTASNLPNTSARTSNSLINAKVLQARQRIYTNIGPYAGNEYGTRNVRADKAANALRRYYRNAATKGMNINTNSTVTADVRNIMNMAIRPRSDRPPKMSNMAWAAAGALAVTAAALPIAAGLTGGGGAVLGGRVANLTTQKAGQAASRTFKNMAETRAKQAVRQGVAKAGPRSGAALARRAAELNKAKINYVKKLLNRAARGNHTFTQDMINKAVQRAGGDSRIAPALEKGGQVARNLLATL